MMHDPANVKPSYNPRVGIAGANEKPWRRYIIFCVKCENAPFAVESDMHGIWQSWHGAMARHHLTTSPPACRQPTAASRGKKIVSPSLDTTRRRDHQRDESERLETSRERREIQRIADENPGTTHARRYERT